MVAFHTSSIISSQKTPFEGTLKSLGMSGAQWGPHHHQALFSKNAEQLLLQD